MSSASPRWFAVMMLATLSTVAAIIAFTATAGLTGSIVGATVVGVIGAGIAGIALRQRLWGQSATVTAAGVPLGVRRLFAVGAPLLVGQLLLVAAFIIDPNVARWDSGPWTPQRSSHSCVSSYWVACDRIDSVRDIYAEEIYSLPQVDPSAPRVGRPLGPLIVDQYEYPPPFLILPRLIATATGDFWGFRRVWFALNLAVVVAGVILVASRFDRVVATHALWLTPFVLLASSTIITLLIGNVQLAIVAMSMIAMLLFERQRHAIGGVLLAYAVVSKLYPGLLLLYLLLRRDWRAVTWIAMFATAFLIISIANFGVGPYVAFATHMPKLLSGEAFPAFRNPQAIAINESIPGLVFKLQLFGVPYMGFAASKAVGWIYTVVAIALTARLALLPVAPGREPLAWLTILILATMRSPFLPIYAPFPSMWLATLLAALTWGRSRVFTTAVIAWIVLAFTFGTGAAPPRVNAISTFAHTVAAFVLVAIVFRIARTPQGRAANRSVVATVGV
jgi:alpha-1,2-mannosyltransferase